MNFISKVNLPITFVSTETLVLSKRLIKKKIRHYSAEIRESEDNEFKKVRREKIKLLKLIIEDLRDIIITY